jgi:hypothetical protein
VDTERSREETVGRQARRVESARSMVDNNGMMIREGRRSKEDDLLRGDFEKRRWLNSYRSPDPFLRNSR